MPAEPAAPPAVARGDVGARTVRRVVAVLALVAILPALYLPNLRHDYYDQKIYMSAMDWWAAGHPLYDYVQPDRVQGALYFTYPPFAALLLAPFGYLRLGVAIAAFAVLTVAAVVVTTRWLVLPVLQRHDLPRGFGLTVAVLLVLAVESTRETLTLGQINMLLVVLILGDLLFAVPQGRRWAGVGVGLAAALFCAISLVVGYVVPKAAGVRDDQAIASSMEIGVHNGTLAIYVAVEVLDTTEISVPAAVYSVFMFVFAALWGFAITRRAAPDRAPAR